MTKPQQPRLRPRTEFRVPPPLVQRIDAVGFTGADLLDEEIGPAGLLFWQAYRDVELWGRAPDRKGLFQPAQADDRTAAIALLDSSYAEIKSTLTALLDVVRIPEQAEPVRIADLCSSLA